MVVCEKCGGPIKRVGFRIPNEYYLYRYPLGEGEKYYRYFAIAFLPTREFPKALCFGSLEINKEDGNEWFNPIKFYKPQDLEVVIVKIISSAMAFEYMFASKDMIATLNKRFLKFICEDSRYEIIGQANAWRLKMEKLERPSTLEGFYGEDVHG